MMIKKQFLLLLLTLHGIQLLYCNDTLQIDKAEYPFYEDNETCFECHANEKFTYYSEEAFMDITKLMCDQYQVKRENFYLSNHGTFACTDCHSNEFTNYPHPVEAKVEQHYTCLDCHGYDEAFAQFHFEEIEAEFMESVHSERTEGDFSCWDCHDPHTYITTYRETEDILQTIQYNNAICLSCHSDFDKFQLLTERGEINIMQTHDWLPNQEVHFKNVRCIECHTKRNDSLLVAHLVMPKDSAVRRCVECHSKNSLLMGTLYKYRKQTATLEKGFFNSLMLETSYVIGANRNYYLNVISIVLFGLTLLGIMIHSILRYINSKKPNNKNG